MSNGCQRMVDAGNGWQVALVSPLTDTPSTTFQYVLTKGATAQDMSNIRICLCPGISDADRLALLESCSYTVSFSDGTEVTSNDCFIDNNIPNENENPASCKGLKFDNIPDEGTQGGTQEEITLDMTFTEPLSVGPVDIGLKTGNTGAVATYVCGPVCNGEPPVDETCPAEAFVRADVCVPVTITPFVNPLGTTTLCCGDPEVTLVDPNAEPPQTCEGEPSITVLITQEICVEVPVEIGATPVVGDATIDPIEVSEEDICEGCNGNGGNEG